MPAFGQDPDYHRFADQRTWLGVPRGADVLSNVAFALVGGLGVLRLVARDRLTFSPATQAGLWCVATGLLLTSAGSAWYHLAPDDGRLAWDRLPMTIVFAGVLAAALAQRVSERIAATMLPLLLFLGVASVVYWRVSGNLAPYGALQFGGAAALLLLVALTRNADDPFPWPWLIGCYAAAKVFELTDGAIFNATSGVIAGHALKHLAAALAGVAALRPLYRVRHR